MTTSPTSTSALVAAVQDERDAEVEWQRMLQGALAQVFRDRVTEHPVCDCVIDELLELTDRNELLTPAVAQQRAQGAALPADAGPLPRIAADPGVAAPDRREDRRSSADGQPDAEATQDAGLDHAAGKKSVAAAPSGERGDVINQTPTPGGFSG